MILRLLYALLAALTISACTDPDAGSKADAQLQKLDVHCFSYGKRVRCHNHWDGRPPSTAYTFRSYRR